MSKPLFFILIAVVILIVSITMYQMRYNEASSLVVPLVMAQITDPEETQIVIDNAKTTFVVCDSNPSGEFSDVKYYNELECDHNILYLKGQCEDSNNTAYNWCYNADMERYLNDRGLKDAPRPPDVWCNMLIDECIAKWEAFKESVTEISEEIGTSDSESTNNLVETLDDTIQELEVKKAAQGGEDDDD